MHPAMPKMKTRPRKPAPVELVKEAEAVAAHSRRLRRQIEDVDARRQEIVAELLNQGVSQLMVARMLDISRQRVTQLADRLRTEGKLHRDCD